MKEQLNCPINLTNGFVLYVSSANPIINPRVEAARMPINCLLKGFPSVLNKPNIEIEIKNTIKKENPPKEGLTSVFHLSWSELFFNVKFLVNLRKIQFIKNEIIKLIIKKPIYM